MEAPRAEFHRWIVPTRPRCDVARDAYHSYLLMPGFSLAFHATTIGVSTRTVANDRKAALAALVCSPDLLAKAEQLAGSFSAKDGLCMALARGRTQLPFWSRMAICEFAGRGLARAELATMFRCSQSTVGNVLRNIGGGFNVMTGERTLTNSQTNPPARGSGPRHRV